MKATSFKTAQTFNKLLALALSVALSSISITAVAEPASEAEAVKRLTSLLSKTNSIQANFTQTTKKPPKKKVAQRNGIAGFNMSKMNKNFSGVMMVQRPNRFRWETTSPIQQLIVADDKTLWVYDPDLEQATKNKVSKKFGSTPALLFSGNPKSIMQSFTVSQPDTANDTFGLVAKGENATFQRLDITFKNNLPSKMVMNDALGQKTTIRFSNVIQNKAIPASKFTFVPPADIDVIEQ